MKEESEIMNTLNINKKLTPLLIFAFLHCCLSNTVLATPPIPENYVVRDLGTLGGIVSRAEGINDSGMVIGISTLADGSSRAFVGDINGIVPLEVQAGEITAAIGINNNNQIVGQAGASINRRAVIWDASGGTTILGQDIPGAGLNSRAFAINDLGQATGVLKDPLTGEARAFISDSTGITMLGVLEDGTLSFGKAINNLGQVVGDAWYKTGIVQNPNRAFVGDESALINLGTLGGVFSFGGDINDSGQVVGHSQWVDGTQTGFIGDTNGIIALGTLAGGVYSQAFAINNEGLIVGAADEKAFISNGPGNVITLKSVVSDMGGFEQLQSARDINSYGDVVGYGQINGETHAFIASTRGFTEPSTEQLLSRWPLDENSGCIAFDVQGLNDGVLGPACTSEIGPNWISGIINSGLDFHGDGSVVEIPAENLQPDYFTVIAWVKANTLNHFDGILMNATTGSWSDGFGIYYNVNDGLTFYVNHYNSNKISTPLSINTWAHIAVSYDGTEMKLYMDGILVNSLLYSQPINYPNPLTVPFLIGKGAGSQNSYGWDGIIDEVTFFDSALSDVQVLNIYDQVTIPPIPDPAPTSIAIEIPFDENTGCIASDISNTYDGSLGPACANSDNPTWTSGVVGSALSFDGFNDVVQFSTDSNLQPDHFTVTAWVKANTLNNFDGVLMNATTGSWADGFGIYYSNNNGLTFYINHYNSNKISTPLSINTWTHIAASYDGTEMKLYIDGILVNSLFYSQPINYPSPLTVPFLIGKGAGGQNSYGWDGIIDEVKIFGTALSDIDIQDIYLQNSNSSINLIADFSSDTNSGLVSLNVQFFDNSIATSTSITTWSWDFNNDGVIDSTEQSPSFTYNIAGTYTVNLTISDGSNSDVETKLSFITVTEAPLVWEHVTKRLVQDEDQDDFTGQSVDIDGELAVIGSHGDNGGRGAAYIIERDAAGLWSIIKKLSPLGLDPFDYFGEVVAISGDTVVVSAALDDDSASDSGAIYVYQRNNGGFDNWGLVKKLFHSDATAWDWFGHGVSISNDTIIAGALRKNNNTGASYVFERNQGGLNNWGETAKLIASDGAQIDKFGYAVSINNNTIIVGSYAHDSNGVDSGSAYIFERNIGGSNQWGERKKLIASDASDGDWFGFSVAIDGDTIVIGAQKNDDISINNGSAYIFERDSGGLNQWGETVKLISSDISDRDLFGYSVSISDDVIVVGALTEDFGQLNTGSAYIFERSGGSNGQWGEIAKIGANDPKKGDSFARSVAIDRSYIVVGASLDDTIGNNSGSIHIFEKR